MSVRISLTFEASEMLLSLHMILSLERAAVVWAILERISGFDPSLEMNDPRYLKSATASSLGPFILISLWKPSSFSSCLDQSPFNTKCGVCIETVYQDTSFFFLFCIYVNIICKAEVSNKSSSDADTTAMVMQCLTHDSF